jgi:hypothetical protein
MRLKDGASMGHGAFVGWTGASAFVVSHSCGGKKPHEWGTALIWQI